MSWLKNSWLQNHYPNSEGAKTDRVVPTVACTYCGAQPFDRCRTKSGAIDPIYHHDRWHAAKDVRSNGVEVPPYQ